MAERLGSEPRKELPLCRFSRPVLSTAQPSLRELVFISQMHIKNNNKYIIYAIAGLIYFQKNDPKKCEDKRSEIVSDISDILNNTKKSEIEKDFERSDETGKSYAETIYFDFKDDYSEYVKLVVFFMERNSLKNKLS